ncbi:MAG TPA: putative toxin-antitoxin system toxin component, PIN family [Acidobacteriaceae bacterium]
MALLRIVLDTNVLVSGVGYPASIPGNILRLCQVGAVDLVLSDYILDEFSRVLLRFRPLKFTPEQVNPLLKNIRLFALLVEPDMANDDSLRDPADRKILATLRASNADYLITGDKDLLALADRYPILTPADFWSRHG